MKNCIATVLASVIMPASLLCMLSCASSKNISYEPAVNTGIDILFTGEQVPDTVFVTVAPVPTDTSIFVKEYIEAARVGKMFAIPVKERAVHISSDSVPSIFNINCDYYGIPPIYLRRREHAEIRIEDLSSRKWEISGLPYNSPIPHSDEFFDLKFKLWKLKRYDFSEEEFHANIGRMSSLLDTIMAEVNPEAATRIMSLLDDDIVVRMFDKLPPGSESTLNYSYACALRNTGLREAGQQRKLEADLAENATVDFSLASLDGTAFDLSSLRGKWVVLDFWVSWCGPCRRGFETMKEIYAGNSDKMEVVAISCGDQTEVWRKLVEELELPWINLLAPTPESHGGTVGGYPVTAYPTKIIIDPAGRMLDYTIGEDEHFYDKLRKFISG